MVGYKMRGDNRGAPLLFCSLHRTISTSFHVPLLLPAPASPPRQGHTCMRIVCFPAKRHKRGCWGALDGVEAMSLGVLPTQSGAQLQEFCSLLTHCCRHLRASPPPPPPTFSWPPLRHWSEGTCVSPGAVPQVARACCQPTWGTTILPTASRRDTLLQPHLPPLAGEQLAPSITPSEIGADVSFVCSSRGDMCSFVGVPSPPPSTDII